jgi:hypothetical protein
VHHRRPLLLGCACLTPAGARAQINEDFFTRTASGGVVTLVASVFMLLLFISELRALPHSLARLVACAASAAAQRTLRCCSRRAGTYLQVRTLTELNVDTSRAETIQINVRAPRAVARQRSGLSAQRAGSRARSPWRGANGRAHTRCRCTQPPRRASARARVRAHARQCAPHHG